MNAYLTASTWLSGFLGTGEGTWLSDLTTNFSLTNVGTVIITALAITIPLVLSWFAFRWVYAKVRGSFRKGK